MCTPIRQSWLSDCSRLAPGGCLHRPATPKPSRWQTKLAQYCLNQDETCMELAQHTTQHNNTSTNPPHLMRLTMTSSTGPLSAPSKWISSMISRPTWAQEGRQEQAQDGDKQEQQ